MAGLAVAARPQPGSKSPLAVATPSAGVTIDCLRAQLFGMPGKVTHVPNFLAWITDNMPAPVETDRVRERLAAPGWPLDDRETGEDA